MSKSSNQDSSEQTVHLGRLPYEDYSHLITLEALSGLLARKGVISPDEYRGLIWKGYMLPRLHAMTEENCMAIRQELLDFMSLEDPKPSTPVPRKAP